MAAHIASWNVSDFNPLPPYGGRQCKTGVSVCLWNFNPLPPYGGRPTTPESQKRLTIFQSTPSVWRETCNAFKYLWRHDISIHSLRMEGDFAEMRTRWTSCHFNPLPPYGGRLLVEQADSVEVGISIHSLRMEGDAPDQNSARIRWYFNPLPPYGGRPVFDRHFLFPPCHFNPLPPYGGRPTSDGALFNSAHFNPLPPYGGRPNRLP